jgi:putative PIN family toxin of toxin-antitoxin system
VTAALAVYDTMVFLQAAINPNRKYTTFEAIESGRIKLCLSNDLIAEIRDVLTRPSLANTFPALTPDRVAQFLDKLGAIATTIADVPQVFTWPQHPDDDHLFNLAIHARANFLVTWETRILKLATEATEAATLLRRLAPGLSIVTPKHIADLLRQTK